MVKLTLIYIKFHTIVSQVSSFVGDPVYLSPISFLLFSIYLEIIKFNGLKKELMFSRFNIFGLKYFKVDIIETADR